MKHQKWILAEPVRIGSNVVIMYNCLMMSRGGITIEDDAMIAANVSVTDWISSLGLP